ncbi:hypothetical protein ACPOL_1314 [Acidisarcina polymorpha]|uniref:Uncharacterized protein n=1 Tax=Acidisarcina polymorpha TaxID=2211140 RepID=A0A2Z5FV84_9BACT|nr:hypothetical protein ACPOL_1314 [Acidisarcina polymorpha]
MSIEFVLTNSFVRAGTVYREFLIALKPSTEAISSSQEHSR